MSSPAGMMRVVLQHGVRDVRLATRPRPTPRPGEALLRIQAVTICASDVHVYAEGNVGGVSWDRPFVPGHEASAMVADGNGTGLAEGTAVVLDPAIPCRACPQCAAGRFHLCRNLQFCDLPPVDGAMGEFLAWPAAQVHPVPESLDPVVTPLLEPLCVAVHATELTSSLAGARVAVVGCGAIGLFTVQMARVRGAKTVYATDPIPERMAVARQLGAEPLPEGAEVDVAFEAAGPPEAVQQCLDMVRPGGEVMVIGIPLEDRYLLRPSQLRRHELTLRFCRRQNENYPEAIALVREGKVVLAPILTHRFPVDRVQDAFALAEAKAEGAVRVAVTFA